MAVMWAYFKVMKPWRELRLCLYRSEVTNCDLKGENRIEGEVGT